MMDLTPWNNQPCQQLIKWHVWLYFRCTLYSLNNVAKVKAADYLVKTANINQSVPSPISDLFTKIRCKTLGETAFSKVRIIHKTNENGFIFKIHSQETNIQQCFRNHNPALYILYMHTQC